MQKSRPLLALFVVWLASCSNDRFPINGSFEGYRVHTTVDHPIASYYVENFLTGQRANQSWDSVLTEIHVLLDSDVPSTPLLKQISNSYSTDLATLILARQLFQNVNQHPLYVAFIDEQRVLTCLLYTSDAADEV